MEVIGKPDDRMLEIIESTFPINKYEHGPVPICIRVEENKQLEQVPSNAVLHKNENEMENKDENKDEKGQPTQTTNERISLSLGLPPALRRSSDSYDLNNLPYELVDMIVGAIRRSSQRDLYSASLVNTRWFNVARKYLYEAPRITGKNYAAFVRTITTPTRNAELPNPCVYVKELNLARIVHEGKPSTNARVLHRVQHSLETFVAPQISFRYNCIVALKHCVKLRVLDLSLISQTVNFSDLFRNISDLEHLEQLNFPRSSVYASDNNQFSWPPKLDQLSIGGGILETLTQERYLPNQVYALSISHCPFTRMSTVANLLRRFSDQLTTLIVHYPMPCLPFNALDSVLILCPKLVYLGVSVDYISRHFFDEEAILTGHPLHQLDLASSGNPGLEHKISPNDIFIAACSSLTNLRVVRVSSRLRWMRKLDTFLDYPAKMEVKRLWSDVRDLVDFLEAKAEEAGEPPDSAVGVWEFDSDRLGSSCLMQGKAIMEANKKKSKLMNGTPSEEYTK